jgi:hypothetical protein
MTRVDTSPYFTLRICRKLLFDGEIYFDPSGIFTLYTSTGF